MPCMKVLWNKSEAPHTDVVGQKGIPAPMELPERSRPIRAEVCHLAYCMDTRIGPPRPIHSSWTPENTLKRELEASLDGQKVLLKLPSVILGTVIFDDRHEFFHAEGPDRRPYETPATTLKESVSSESD